MNNWSNQTFRFNLPALSGILFMLFFSTCTPSIQYLGDKLQPTYTIDVYYDEKDVEKEYRTLGKMTHGNMFDYEVEIIKNKMIAEAKSFGGDGIIFMEVKNVREQNGEFSFGDEDRLAITAKVIKYKEK
jgi:hypothetical protein